MERSKKEDVVAEVQDKLGRTSGVVLSDFRGLDVKELAELRRALRKDDVEYKIYKNTLTKIAVKDTVYQGLADLLEGPTAIAFSYSDAISAAKTLAAFAKEHKSLKLKGGYLEGSVLSADGIRMIALLPSRDVLLAQSIGLLQSPIRNLAGVMQGLLQSFVGTLQQINEQKQA